MKKFLLLGLLLAAVLMLSACSCKHANIIIQNAVEATCTESGYAGDSYCSDCEKVIRSGETIPALGHQPSERTSLAGATCSQAGYTGDVYCTICWTMLDQGEVIDLEPHTPGKRKDVREATCTEYGYTGDVYCSVCNVVCEWGDRIDRLPHTPGERRDVREATCTERGYTGDVYCTVCEQCIESGERTACIDHTPGEPQEVRAATCTDYGYTGNIYCTVCEQCIEYGDYTDTIAHTPGERKDVVAATCVERGYTGDVYCMVCERRIESGERIERIEHTPGDPVNAVAPTCTAVGYTGDLYCTFCEAEVQRGEVAQRLAHSYQDEVCEVCGWTTPGLYVDGALQFTWDEMKNNGYVTMNEDRLEDVADGLYGKLIVGEDVLRLKDGCFNYSQLSEVWLPAGVTQIPDRCFEYAMLETVRSFGKVTKMGYNIFYQCANLKNQDVLKDMEYVPSNCFDFCTGMTEYVIPEGVTSINSQYAFSENHSLQSVTLPSTLKVIGYGAFNNTPMLTSINLPEGLEEIEGRGLRGSGLESVVFPSTLVEYGSEILVNCAQLTTLDMSKVTAAWDNVNFENFNGSEKLSKVILPENLKAVSGYWVKLPSLKRLELPDSVSACELRSEYIEELVWPVQLSDGNRIMEFMPNLKTVYYRGSEFQWSLIAGHETIAAEVVYNYTGEEVEAVAETEAVETVETVGDEAVESGTDENAETGEAVEALLSVLGPALAGLISEQNP